MCALHTVCAWLGNEGRGGEGKVGLLSTTPSLPKGVGLVHSRDRAGEFSQVSVELKAFLRHGDSSTKLKLICILIDAWHEFFVLVLAAKVVLNYFKRFSIDFFVVVTLKEFDLV